LSQSNGADLITRYKRTYSVPDEVEITEQMILDHWELERQLARELIESTPENRWETFERCYTRFFSELKGIHRLLGKGKTTLPHERYKIWIDTIGAPPQKIFEIGSGKGGMIAYLAECGFECKGSEITRERGKKHLAVSHPNLSWGVSDGIHLDRFESPGSYDVVVSDHVIEHLHPDDIEEHFQGVYNILVKGGRYIFRTPHRYTGPHDMTRFFNYNTPQCFHLKEYTYQELRNVLRNVGFRCGCVATVKFKNVISSVGIENHENVFLDLMLIDEKILSVIPNHSLRRSFAARLKRVLRFRDNIFLIAKK
jgi:SAM-dependent methyltransferase